jgi:hypothetical protein
MGIVLEDGGCNGGKGWGKGLVTCFYVLIATTVEYLIVLREVVYVLH